MTRFSMNLPHKDYPHSTALKPSVRNLSSTPDDRLTRRAIEWIAFLVPTAFIAVVYATYLWCGCK